MLCIDACVYAESDTDDANAHTIRDTGVYIY